MGVSSYKKSNQTIIENGNLIGKANKAIQANQEIIVASTAAIQKNVEQSTKVRQ
jgi:hypothetical protein